MAGVRIEPGTEHRPPETVRTVFLDLYMVENWNFFPCIFEFLARHCWVVLLCFLLSILLTSVGWAYAYAPFGWCSCSWNFMMGSFRNFFEVLMIFLICIIFELFFICVTDLEMWIWNKLLQGFIILLSVMVVSIEVYLLLNMTTLAINYIHW